MKQISAFMHPHRVGTVTEALRNSGLCDLSTGVGCYNVTVSPVQRLHTDRNRAQQHYSVGLAEPVVAEMKLELICDDHLAVQLQQIIIQAAHPSPGWIFISDIRSAMPLS
ncbi:P-II family nitrogen regulator [Noviherbaspirillum sp. 1P10PC]|uniref:P-II family nitrogen regulator n=1 Tax=Noviherbaspirillum sp. 1P10PC TaxID=3132292 RepID=UPI00399FA620